MRESNQKPSRSMVLIAIILVGATVLGLVADEAMAVDRIGDFSDPASWIFNGLLLLALLTIIVLVVERRQRH